MIPFVLTGDPQTVSMDGPYAGAVVDVLTDIPHGVASAIGGFMVRFEEPAALQAAWVLFASDVLVGWNLYDRRGVVPADADAFGRVSPRFIVALLGAWADLMTEEPSAR